MEAVKEKLWRKCGTSVNSMQLELYDDANSKISSLTDDSRPLGFYSPYDGLVFFYKKDIGLIIGNVGFLEFSNWVINGFLFVGLKGIGCI